MNKTKPSQNPTRKCIVTQKIVDISKLLRFVCHDGKIYFDLKNNLPGRGIWVENCASSLKIAIEKKLFSRAAKQFVEVQEDLINVVENQLKQDFSNNVCLIARTGKFCTRVDEILNHIKFDNIKIVFCNVSEKSNSYKNLFERCKYKGIEFVEEFDINFEELIGKNNLAYFAVINCKVAKIFKESYYKYKEFKEISSE